MKRKREPMPLVALAVALLARDAPAAFPWRTRLDHDVAFDGDGQVVACGPGAAQNHPVWKSSP